MVGVIVYLQNLTGGSSQSPAFCYLNNVQIGATNKGYYNILTVFIHKNGAPPSQIECGTISRTVSTIPVLKGSGSLIFAAKASCTGNCVSS